MANIQDLLALARPGGGGAPMPPGGAPMPGGAGMPPGGMGGAIQQVLSRLMQDPAARAGMQRYMQQMQGGAPPMAAPPGNAQAGPPQGPSDIPPEGAPQDMQPGKEQDMVNGEIDRKGATFDGVDAPTQNDIERLTEDPSPTMIKAFDAQFGEGSAEKYLEEEKGEQQDEEDSQQSPPSEESGEY